MAANLSAAGASGSGPAPVDWGPLDAHSFSFGIYGAVASALVFASSVYLLHFKGDIRHVQARQGSFTLFVNTLGCFWAFITSVRYIFPDYPCYPLYLFELFGLMSSEILFLIKMVLVYFKYSLAQEITNYSRLRPARTELSTYSASSFDPQDSDYDGSNAGEASDVLGSLPHRIDMPDAAGASIDEAHPDTLGSATYVPGAWSAHEAAAASRAALADADACSTEQLVHMYQGTLPRSQAPVAQALAQALANSADPAAGLADINLILGDKDLPAQDAEELYHEIYDFYMERSPSFHFDRAPAGAAALPEKITKSDMLAFAEAFRPAPPPPLPAATPASAADDNRDTESKSDTRSIEWFMKHRYLMDTRWLLRAFGILMLILTIPSFVILSTTPNILSWKVHQCSIFAMSAIGALHTGVFVVLVLIVSFRYLRQVDESLYILTELKIVAFVAGTLLGVYVVFRFVFDNIDTYEYAISSGVMIMGSNIITFISCVFPFIAHHFQNSRYHHSWSAWLWSLIWPTHRPASLFSTADSGVLRMDGLNPAGKTPVPSETASINESISSMPSSLRPLSPHHRDHASGSTYATSLDTLSTHGNPAPHALIASASSVASSAPASESTRRAESPSASDIYLSSHRLSANKLAAHKTAGGPESEDESAGQRSPFGGSRVSFRGDSGAAHANKKRKAKKQQQQQQQQQHADDADAHAHARHMIDEASNYIKLSEILRHPQGHDLFKNFLAKEFAVENILFLEHIVEFRKWCQLHLRRPDRLNPDLFKRAVLIFDKFLSPSAPFEVNLTRRGSAEGLRKLLDEYERLLMKSADVYGARTSDAAADPPPVPPFDGTLFDDAYIEIYRLLDQDSYLRFRHTPEYARLSKGMLIMRRLRGLMRRNLRHSAVNPSSDSPLPAM